MGSFKFTKADLHYKDYSWKTTDGDSAKVKGFPDNVLLNRREGYEVVHFIDRFISTQVSWQGESDESKKELGTKIEKTIRSHVPSDTRSQDKIHKWIANNWESTHPT